MNRNKNQQQNISKMSVKQTKPMPLELLVNIFREAGNLYFNELRKWYLKK
uniref:Uncharacterized protein n=1 Tax=Meloidogyne enterolobii TaxID=390850 RepID=A0A6V7WYV0_MELEN|nr:unnamed protein product [Meloidogyne enterolobii]